MQPNREVATTSPRFFNKPHLLHDLFVKVVPGTIFTSRSKHHFVVIGKAEQQVRTPSHCGDLCLFNSWIKRETHDSHIFNVSAYATTAVQY